jgi:ketosteroid isomerase-like protein
MPKPSPKQTALRFNDCINRQDIDGLSSLMTEDHTFIDRENGVYTGKERMKKGWTEFFESFPDYRNTFERVQTQGDLVVIYGYAIWEKGGDRDYADRTKRFRLRDPNDTFHFT